MTDRTDHRIFSTFEVDARDFDLLVEMVRMTTASKAWRAPIADAFGDNRFFNASPSTHAHWAEVVTALMAADKERFPDLIGQSRVLSAHGAD